MMKQIVFVLFSMAYVIIFTYQGVAEDINSSEVESSDRDNRNNNIASDEDAAERLIKCPLIKEHIKFHKGNMKKNGMKKNKKKKNKGKKNKKNRQNDSQGSDNDMDALNSQKPTEQIEISSKKSNSIEIKPCSITELAKQTDIIKLNESHRVLIANACIRETDENSAKITANQKSDFDKSIDRQFMQFKGKKDYREGVKFRQELEKHRQTHMKNARTGKIEA